MGFNAHQWFINQSGDIESSWDITTLQLAFQQQVNSATPTGIFFKPDGLHLYLGNNSGLFEDYILSTAWDTSTISLNYSGSMFSGFQGVSFRESDGLKLYIVANGTDDIYEYDLPTAWDISVKTFVRQFSMPNNITGLYFRQDGLMVYFSNNSQDVIHQYSLSTSWNISTMVFVRSYSVSTQTTVPQSVEFKHDGTKMYVGSVGGAYSSHIIQYDLSIAWDISTAIFYGASNVAAAQGIYIKQDGTKLYTFVNAPSNLREFNMF